MQNTATVKRQDDEDMQHCMVATVKKSTETIWPAVDRFHERTVTFNNERGPRNR
jgi:hypothetical protein